MVGSDVYTAVWKKLIYEIYHVYGSGKLFVFPILGVTAFSVKAFSYFFLTNHDVLNRMKKMYLIIMLLCVESGLKIMTLRP